MEYNVKCPILNREIDNGYCYEITTAAYGLIKMDCLDDEIERNTACNKCDECHNNQIKNTH